jgi:hypothetical protein
MDVITTGGKEIIDDQNIYILSADDVENILVATDALYWTILQNLRGRDRPSMAKLPHIQESTPHV